MATIKDVAMLAGVSLGITSRVISGKGEVSPAILARETKAIDEMAVSALSYFRQAGISVARAVSVIGYDDTPSAQYSAPPLTSLPIAWRELTLNGSNALLHHCYRAKRAVRRDFQNSVTLRASLEKPAKRGTA
jgi:LacI family transcriptional regulator